MASDSLRSLEDCDADQLLTLVTKTTGASDLHFAVGLPPVLRVDGKLMQAPYQNFTPQLAQRFIYGILTDEQIREFEEIKILDFTYALDSQHHFLVNIFRDKGTIAAAFRSLPN